MSITAVQKNEIRQIPIVGYLEKKGYKPEKIRGNEYYYSSMGANEHTPSFRVNIVKNRYQDYSGNQSATGLYGDIINLVMHVEQCSFLEACQRLANEDFKPVTVTTTDTTEKDNHIEVLGVQHLIRKPLLDYLESRAIPYSLANKYCCQVDYINGGKKFFGIGFKNVGGGYAIRSALFKGQTVPNTYTFIKGYNPSNFINVFEGFISFLSALKSLKLDHFRNDCVVLNSLSNFDKFLTELVDKDKERLYLNLFLDNDKAGIKNVKKIHDGGYNYTDCSNYYDGYKDFNDLLTNKPLQA